MEDQFSKLLAVGPLPPPVGGATVSFQVFCDELSTQYANTKLQVIDTSPKQLKKQSHIISIDNVIQAWNIIRAFLQHVKRTDAVLIFGSNGFVSSMAPFLFFVSKLFRKPCFIRSFGGSLDQFYERLNPFAQRFLLNVLRQVDGLIVETRLLQRFFVPLIGNKVYFVPGYRRFLQEVNQQNMQEDNINCPGCLRLVFVGLVREEKGIFVLLESLRQLSDEIDVVCDIFGPVFAKTAGQFECAVEDMKNVSYQGVINAKQVVPLLRKYDALVLPTYYQGEGHPGVIIEAMQAGIPVITTQFRAIPEIVEDEVNGLLVTPQDSTSLVKAIQKLYHSRQLLTKMAQENKERAKYYDASHLVPQIISVLGINN